MAKAKPASTAPQIIREDTDWGVRLIVRPLADTPHMAMEISVEIDNPKPGRGAEFRTRFSGVPVSAPLRATDVVVWLAQMKAIQDQAKEIAAEMKAKAEKPKRKKASS